MDTLYFEQELVPARTVSLNELVATFFQYHTLDQQTTHGIKRAFKLLDELFPNLDTSTIGKKALYLFQSSLTSRYDRKYCNRLIKFIRRVFKWGTIVDIVTPTKAYELTLVPSLRKGDGRCHDNKERTDAPAEDIEAVLPHLKPIIADMLRLQHVHGMRPSEVCRIKPSMINQKYDGENWLYLPEEHKTASKGKGRAFVFGKESQRILQKYMTADHDQYIFLNRNKRPFSSAEYGRKIKRVIDKNVLHKFVAYQVRHTAATWIDEKFGLEHARAFLGHATTTMTRRYVHNNHDIAKIQQVATERESRLIVPDEMPPITPERPVLRIFRGE